MSKIVQGNGSPSAVIKKSIAVVTVSSPLMALRQMRRNMSYVGKMKISKFGKKRIELCDATGKKHTAVIDYAIIPDLWVTLFSLTKAMNSGF